MRRAERTVDILNAANRFQEFIFRRAVFAAKLDAQLKTRGESLDDIVAENRIGTIPREDIEVAVAEALEFTFAKNFPVHSAAGRFVRFITGLPGATLFIPFPRFMMNSVKFQFEFSPLGVLKLATKSERAAMRRGDMKVISRAVIGSVLLLLAWQLRNSDFAGERWYELRLKDGRTIDLRPFNPLASYLFVADIAKRMNEGTLSSFGLGELSRGILSSSLRAGTGLFIIDSIIEAIAGIGDREKAARVLKSFAGNVLSGFLIPLQQVRDVFAEFDERDAVIRDTDGQPFLGPFRKRLPFAARGLPEVELPTRSAPPIRRQPLVRQLTGLGFRDPKNPAERELDRLGFRRGEILASTGNPELDRLAAKHMGPLVETELVALVEDERYKRLSNAGKAAVLSLALKELRGRARAAARFDDPLGTLRQKLKDKFPRRLDRFIEESTGRPLQDVVR